MKLFLHLILNICFLNIRGKSVGEEVEVVVICPDDGETYAPVKINIDEVEVKKSDEHSNKIKLDENLGDGDEVSLDQFIKSNFDFSEDDAMDQSFDMVATCIDKDS